MPEGVPRGRVVLLRSPVPGTRRADGSPQREIGTGTLVAERLVLTAAHAVFHDGRPLPRIELGQLDRLDLPDDAGRVVWPPSWTKGTGLDVALVEVTDQGWPPLTPSGPVRLGWFTGSAGGIGLEAIGFPRVLKDPGGTRMEDQLSGTVNPAAAASAGRYLLDVTTPAPVDDPDGRKPWGGASGAGVFAAGLLTGVIVIDTPGYGHDRLTAVPAHRLLADPAARAVLAEHGVPLGLASVELDPLLDPPETARRRRGQDRSPAGLLRADRGLVPFYGRDQLVGDLLGWCLRDPSEVSVRLITGPGGQGKTRLGHHLKDRLTEVSEQHALGSGSSRRWVSGLLRRDPSGDDSPIDLRSLAATSPAAAGGVLLVVDYAETRTALLRRLLPLLWNAEDGPPIRLLLLARSDGEWWRDLTRDLDDPLGPVLALPPLDQSLPARTAGWQRTLTALSARPVGLPALDPAADWPVLAADIAPPSDLGHDRYGSPLTLQMTALTTLLQAGPHPVPETSATTGDDMEAVEETLLRHERRYWSDTATNRGITLHATTLAEAVTTAALLPVTDERDALQILADLTGLSDQSIDTRRTVAGWLADLYPHPAGAYWGPLQPDRVGEHLISSITRDNPSLLTALLSSATVDQAYNALTVRPSSKPARRQVACNRSAATGLG